jgi:DNA-binding XRE family transcriptional regulator
MTGTPTPLHNETALARILRQEGRKQVWLAEQVGVSRNTMNAYVRGLHVPDDKRILIAEVLGRTVEELFPSHEAESVA